MRIDRFRFVFLLLVSGGMLLPSGATAQWEHRYTKLDDFGHHTYLEQHELPILAHGPTDPAPAPDGKHLAFAAQGWLWLLDIDSGIATQLTNSADIDARPRWSADGTKLAFVRDTGSDTAVVVLDVASGKEATINTPTIELDPEFSEDGSSVFYTSGVGGSLSLWRHDLAAGTDTKLTDLRQVERNARRLADGEGIVYLHGSGAHRTLRARYFLKGSDSIIHSETLTYHLTADTHPSEALIVYSAPIDNDYHLWTMDIRDPRVTHRLTDGNPFALTPAFSADGNHVYFVEANKARQFELKRIATYGGKPEVVEIVEWQTAGATGSIALTIHDADDSPVTARVSLTRRDGHPVSYDRDATYFDPQTGRHYFYVQGDTTMTLPVGTYTALIARGPMYPVIEKKIRIRRDRETELAAKLTPLWDAKTAGYVSADHHIHLNGDGHHRANHLDALRLMAGEAIDQLSTMSWNRWQRRIDAPLVARETTRDGFSVQQAQEVRSHFHGHIGLPGTKKAYAPWFFGPNNPTLGNPDQTNGDVIAFGNANGALPTYVHPIVGDDDPFAQLEDNPIPLELVSDGVLSERMGIELVCAWTSSLGTAHVWYRLLNIGRPVAAMSGTDSWVDFHRTPALGTGRTYVRAPQDASSDAVLGATAEGKGFVTTGPALLFSMNDSAQPGDTIASGAQSWQLTLASTTAVDIVEIVVNGEVVKKLEGIAAGQQRDYSGDIDLPAGGWIAARAYASEYQDDAWPTMHRRPFAHSSPIWLGEIGSFEPNARAQSAIDLIRAIDTAEAQARAAYGDVPTPKLDARFDEARAKLRSMLIEEERVEPLP